jgi:NAD(P)-dependent dehydrogenase (short-subunit alcohol dehydrogenase family)
MHLNLQNRVALITGGSKGIGLAMARHLGGAGARLVICARHEQTLSEARTALESAELDVLSVVADVSVPQDIEALVAAAHAHFGRIDMLVNNAVSSSQNAFDALSDEEWRHHIDVKLMGYIRCARAVLPHMKAQGWGRIVNVAGITARDVSAYRMTNGVVNAGVTNFTKHLAEQVGAFGVTVNAIHPGYTWTPRLESALEKWAALEGLTLAQVTALRLKEIPVGRFIQPADMAQLAVFLCSDAASAITGQAIAVDGGSGRAIPY